MSVKDHEALDLLPDEKKLEVLDQVYEEIWSSDQDIGSKIEATRANRELYKKILNQLLNKMS